MTEGDSKEFEMAVGTSNVLDSTGMMEEANYYSPLETNESESPVHDGWSGPKEGLRNLCRSCANSSDYLIPIYEGEGLEHQLEHKIQKHLPIQVSLADTLPLHLCYQCASTLIAWDSMITSCLEADKKFRAIQEAAMQESKSSEIYEDSQSHMEEEEEEEDNDHNNDHDNDQDNDHDNENENVNDMIDDSDDEPLIKTKAMGEKGRATPIKKKILSKAKNTETPGKNKTATNSKDEVDEEERQRWEPVSMEKTGNSSEIMKRRKFPKEMESISVLSPNGSLKNIYRCKLCGHKTNRSNNLKAHLQIHKRVVPYKCEKCGKRYTRRQDGKDHLRSIEIVLECTGGGEGQTKKLYRCKLCGHTSNRSNNLKKHLRSHESTQELMCESCGGKCIQSNVMNYHVKEIEVVTGQDDYGKSRKRFRCRICGDTFERMISCRTHITSHKPINIYACKVCGKEYLCEKSLKEHSMSAHGEFAPTMINFPYKCEYCDQLFAEKAACEEHRQSHGGERPYICHTCGCAFRTQSSLYIHTKIHGSIVPGSD